MAISMLKIRRPLGRLIFNMGIAIPGKTVFLIETAPRDTSMEYGSPLFLVQLKMPFSRENNKSRDDTYYRDTNWSQNYMVSLRLPSKDVQFS